MGKDNKERKLEAMSVSMGKVGKEGNSGFTHPLPCLYKVIPRVILPILNPPRQKRQTHTHSGLLQLWAAIVTPQGLAGQAFNPAVLSETGKSRDAPWPGSHPCFVLHPQSHRLEGQPH